MPEPRPIQAVVTAPETLDTTRRIEQIFLFNPDGTPYTGPTSDGGDGGGPSTPTDFEVKIDSIGEALNNSSVPANITSGWSFGPDSSNWNIDPREVSVVNSSGANLVGALTVEIPYSLLLPNVSSGLEIALFTFEAKVYVDEDYLFRRIIAHTLTTKAGFIGSASASIGQGVVSGPATIATEGSTVKVVIENGLIAASAVLSGSPTLALDPPIYTFIGKKEAP